MFGPLVSAAMTVGSKVFDFFQNRKAEKERANFNPVLKRVQDAQAAGVHPIYALGATGLDTAPQKAFQLGDDLGKMGQNIGSAIDKHMDVNDKTMKSLYLEKAGLENELLRAQITKANRDMNATPSVPSINPQYLPVDGQGQSAQADLREMVKVPGGHKLQQPEYTPNLQFGWPYRTNPHFSDAQTMENRYGEGWGAVLGTGPMIGDLPYWWRYGLKNQWATPEGQVILKGLQKKKGN